MIATRSNWRRLARGATCPVCGHRGWCTVTADGTAANCTRTPNDHPIKGRKNPGEIVGYLHKLDGTVAHRASQISNAEPVPKAELAVMARTFIGAIPPARFTRLIESLGVTERSLRRLSIGWFSDREAWAFPMRDSRERVVGIRLRTDNGRKFAVTGGREGLFIPTGLGTDPLLICEGPTSLAALLDLGFDAIGRPSCNSGVSLVRNFLMSRPKRDVIVWGDRDEVKHRPDGSTFQPGQDGARALASAIRDACSTVAVFIPPVKDAREWVKFGATRSKVEAAMAANAW